MKIKARGPLWALLLLTVYEQVLYIILFGFEIGSCLARLLLNSLCNQKRPPDPLDSACRVLGLQHARPSPVPPIPLWPLAIPAWALV